MAASRAGHWAAYSAGLMAGMMAASKADWKVGY